jgi:hypothetical protein
MTESQSPRYRIVEEIEGAYVARSEGGRDSLLIPVTDARPPAERVAGDLLLTFPARVHFDIATGAFVSNAAVIECTSERLVETFRVLATDVARALRAKDTKPTPHQVSASLARWEELLRAKRVLSREEEFGLWGELWLILQLSDTSMAVATWRGPDAEWVDFVGGGIGVECKVSRSRLEHFVSQEQVTRPLGDLEVFFLSIWVDLDLVAGMTISDLISQVDGRLDDRREFEEKLLGTGYSRVDASLYKMRLRLLEPPLVFPAAAIPRVQLADPGVSHIRFLAALDERDALRPAVALATLMRLGASGS